KFITLFIGNPRNGRGHAFLKNYSFDVLLSVNYLYLIEEDLIKMPRRFAINLHGSLLPKYRGRTPHVWAIINGEKKTGVTAHLITKGCDEGPIVSQIQIPIEIQDTGNDILNKFKQKYP